MFLLLNMFLIKFCDNFLMGFRFFVVLCFNDFKKLFWIFIVLKYKLLVLFRDFWLMGFFCGCFVVFGVIFFGVGVMFFIEFFDFLVLIFICWIFCVLSVFMIFWVLIIFFECIFSVLFCLSIWLMYMLGFNLLMGMVFNIVFLRVFFDINCEGV